LSFCLLLIVQDLLQVFLLGNVLVPEYFLIWSFSLLLLEKEEFRKVLWICFFGGLFWDLRWTGLLGFTAGIYSFCIILVHWIWFLFPSSGRTPILFFSLSWFATLLVSLARVVVWSATDGVLSHAFLVQQVCTIPVLLILTTVFARRIASENA